MNTFLRYLLPLIFLGNICAQISAQSTTTIGGVRTGTNGNITATTSFAHLNITGSDYRIPMSEVAKAILENTTFTSGTSSLFSIAITNTTPTTAFNTLTIQQSANGVLSLSSLFISSTGSVTLTQAPLQVITTTTAGVYCANLTGTGGIVAGRTTSGWSYLASSGAMSGTSSPSGFVFGNNDGAIHIRFPSSRYCDFYSEGTALFGATSSGLTMYTGTADFRNAQLRWTTTAAAASGSITTSSTIETLSGTVTRTMSITSNTGRIYWYHNIGASTCTIHGGGANINGAATQGIMSGSSAILFSDGTNAYGLIK